MKNLFLWSIVFILGWSLARCGEADKPIFDHTEENPGESEGTNDTETQADTINFLLLNDGVEYSEVIPRMIFTYKGWTGIELSDASNQESVSFQFVNQENKDKILVTVDNHSVTFMEYDPISDTAGNEVFTITEINENLRCTQLDFDWETGEYDIVSDSILLQTSLSGRQGRSFEDDIKEDFYEFFSAIGNSLTSVSYFLPVSSQAVCEIWTNVAVPAAQYMLYSDDPEKLEEISNGMFVENGLVLAVNVTFTGKIKQLLNICYSGFKGIQVYQYFADDDYTDEDYTDEGSYGIFSSINNYKSALYQAKTEIEELYDSYRVSIQVSNVTENSATLHGDFTNLDGRMPYISGYGFQYCEDGATIGESDIEASQFPGSITITNLKPGTRYRACAYLKSMGETYYSTIAYFTTKRVFEISPTSLNFEQDGGEQEVKVTLPSDDWTWTIASKPEWCEITSITPESFRVKVEKNQEITSRHGSITVKAKQSDGTTEEKTLTVEQGAYSLWDGTSWNFEGIIKMTGVEDFSISFGLTVIDVATNRFTLSGELTGMEKYSQISCNEKNQLILEYTQKVSAVGMYSETGLKFVIERTDDMNATATLTGYTNITDPDMGNENYRYNGTFQGTRN